MALRSKYKIPFSLDVGSFDIRVTLSSSDGIFKTKRPITLKSLLLFVLGVLVFIVTVTQSSILQGSILASIIFVFSYFFLLFLLVSPTKTKQMGLNWIYPTMFYMFKVNRRISTRGSSLIGPLRDLYGIDEINDDGVIKYINGDYGEIFKVTGYASVMMFENDRNQVLQSTSKFYTNMPTGVSLIFDTMQSAQNVDDQVESIIKQRKNLKSKSKGLRALQKTEYSVIKDYVGEKFKSTQQLLIVRAESEDRLDSFNSHFSDFGGQQFVRDAAFLERNEILKYFNDIYGG